MKGPNLFIPFFDGRIKHYATHCLALNMGFIDNVWLTSEWGMELNMGSIDNVWLMSEWGMELRHGMEDSIVCIIGFRYYILSHSRLKTMLFIAFRSINLCP
jgi:hypothetical protein